MTSTGPRRGRSWRAPGLLGLALLAAGCLSVPPVTGEAQPPGVGEPRVLIPSQIIAELYQTGEVRRFEFRQGGELIGTSAGRYEGPRPGEGGNTEYHFSVKNTLRVPGRAELRTEGRLVIDDEGRIVRGWEQSEAARLSYETVGGTLVLVAGDEREEVSYGAGDGYMGFMSTLHEELLFASWPVVDGSWSRRVLNLSGGAPTPWEASVVERRGDTVVVRTSLGEEVTLADGRILRIEVPADDLVVEPVPAQDAEFPAWTVDVAAPLVYRVPQGAGFELRPVELPGRAGEPALAGEVLVPDPSVAVPGDRGETRRPAVLFLSGSGLVDRHGFAGPPPLDLGSHEITDALAEAGFVVLRYDEPGYGESEEAPLSWTRQLEDARRALRTLMIQPEVDPSRILVVGHGEGGWRGLTLARARPREVTAVALLGPPGRSYREILERNAAAVRAELGPDDRARALSQHTELMSAIEAGRGLPASLTIQAQWLREVLDVDPAVLMAALADAPDGPASLWLAFGDKDLEVDVDDAARRLEGAARSAGLSVETSRFSDLDHLFKREEGEVSTPASYRETRPVDPAFLESLVVWARTQAAR